jgi:hypothetical protein
LAMNNKGSVSGNKGGLSINLIVCFSSNVSPVMVSA